MEGLDLSGLSDDQLVELVRACCAEAIARNPAVAAAAKDVMISEAERLRIMQNATESELAAARARERRRIAQEAAERVGREQLAEKAKRAAEKAANLEWRNRMLLRQASTLVGYHPSKIALLYVHTKYGPQIYINDNPERFTRVHLCTFSINTGEVKSKKDLVKKKPELAKFCIHLASEVSPQTHIIGQDYDWPEEL